MTAENKRYYWLKLPEDFFRQKEIKRLRKIAGGEVFVIIYLKMLLRSLKDNGRLYYEGIEDDFASELALDIDEDAENVKLTIAYLMSKKILVQSDSDEYEILTAQAMTGSEGYSAGRMRRLRDKKLLASHCDAPVTASDEEIEIDKEIEKEKIKNTSSRKRDKNVVSPGFDEFWKVYPRHVAKQNAVKAWAKTGADDSQALTDSIIADVKQRLDGEWRGKDMQYIPHPATYLNQRRWEDETGVTKVAEHPRSDEPVVLTPEEEAEIARIYAQNGRDAFM